MRHSRLAQRLQPWLYDAVNDALDGYTATGGSGGSIPGEIYTYIWTRDQYPEALLRDGSRSLTGNLSVASGVTIDGVDIDAFYNAYLTHHHDSLYVNVTGDSMSGALTVNMAGGNAGSVTPLLDLSSTGNTTGAASGFKMRTASGYAATIFTAQNQWRHAFGDGTGNVLWGFDGTDLKVGADKVWDAGNDGTGSGLDADVLDGWDSTAFPRKAENATISGAWTFTPNQIFSTSITTPRVTASAAMTIDPIGALSLTPGGAMTVTPAGNLTLDPTGNIEAPGAQTWRSSNFSSGLSYTGWQINEESVNRNVFTIFKVQVDELRAKVFVADEVRIDRGEQVWARSFGIVNTEWTTPAAIGGNGVETWWDNSPAVAGAIFSDADWIRLRIFDSSSGFTIANIWGQVYSAASGGVNGYLLEGAPNNRQRWRFVLRNGLTSYLIRRGVVAIDYGASGQAYIHLSAVDGAGAPYMRFTRWTGSDPYSFNPANADLVQIGRLTSISGPLGTTGIFVRNGVQTFEGGDGGVNLGNVAATWYSGATPVVKISQATGIELDYGNTVERRVSWKLSGTEVAYIGAWDRNYGSGSLGGMTMRHQATNSDVLVESSNGSSTSGFRAYQSTIYGYGAYIYGGVIGMNASTLAYTSAPFQVGTGMWMTNTWSGYPASNTGYSEIANDTGSFKALMLVGNRSGDALFNRRHVQLYDRLTISTNRKSNSALTMSSSGDTSVMSFTTSTYGNASAILWQAQHVEDTGHIYDPSIAAGSGSSTTKYAGDNFGGAARAGMLHYDANAQYLTYFVQPSSFGDGAYMGQWRRVATFFGDGRLLLQSNGATSPGIYFGESGPITSLFGIGSSLAFLGLMGVNDTDPLGIYHNGNWRFWVDSTGNTTVSGKLSVSRDADTMQLVGNTYSYMEFYPRTAAGRKAYFGFATSNTTHLYLINEDTGSLYLGTAGATRATIDNAGKMGIGTTSPIHKLDVAGRAMFRSDGTFGAGVWMADSAGTAQAFVGQDGVTAGSSVGFYHNLAWRLRVTTGGAVVLHQSGALQFRNQADTANVTALSINASDRIELAEIEQLRTKPGNAEAVVPWRFGSTIDTISGGYRVKVWINGVQYYMVLQ